MTDIPVIYKPKGPFPLWMADFEADTKHLNAAEQMQYLRVLVHLWHNGGYMLADRRALRVLMGIPASRHTARQMAAIWQMLDWWTLDADGHVKPTYPSTSNSRKAVEKWPEGFTENGVSATDETCRLLLSQKRVRAELAKLHKISATRKESGISGAEKKYGKSYRPEKANAKKPGSKCQPGKKANAKGVSQHSLSIEREYSPPPSNDSRAKDVSPTGNVVPIKDRPSGGDGGGRGFPIEELAKRLCDIIGVDPAKQSGFAAHNDIRLWISEGCDPDLDIVGAIEDVTRKARANGSAWPPGSFAYFRRAVSRARAARLERHENAEKDRDEQQAKADVPRGGWSRASRERSERIVHLKTIIRSGHWFDGWGDEPTKEAAEKELERLEAERQDEIRRLREEGLLEN